MGQTHGHRSGNWKSPTYSSWQNMLNRCLRPDHPYYHCYGGRGIKVCDRWRGTGGFARFLADVGVRPDGMTLDRVDTDGNYEPDNVRWATPKQQAWNRRHLVAVAQEYAQMGATVDSPPPAVDLPF